MSRIGLKFTKMPHINLSLNKIPRQLTALSGIIFGILAYLSIGNFMFIALSLCVLLFFYSHILGEDRSFIFRAASAGFILRVVIIFLYYYSYLHTGHADVIGPDGETYSQHGWYISRLLVGGDPYRVPNHSDMIFREPGHYSELAKYFKQELPSIGSYQIGVFTYLIGILYAVFDYSPLIIKLINSTFSILTGVLLYFIGREIFNSKIGKWSMVSLLFLPSIVIYSTTALRDTIVVFMVTLIIWLMTKFQKTRKLIWLILACLVALTIEYVRVAVKYPLLILMTLLALFNIRTSLFKKNLIVLFICLMLFSVGPVREKLKSYFDPNVFFSVHLGYVNTKGNNYMIFPERCYAGSKFIGLGPIEIAGGVAKGIFHLFFEPLPMRIGSVFTLPAILQTLVLLIIMPFIIVGIITGIRYRFYQVMPVLAYLAIFIPLMAVTEGNIGTVFRHRDMLMPFLIVFGIAGLYTKIGNKSPL